MKKTILIFVFLLIGIFGIYKLEPLVYRLHNRGLEKTPIANLKMRLTAGTKYIPGKPNASFFEDEDILTYYSFERDSTGKAIKKKCYNIGPDKTKFTTDDTLKYYVVYEYDKEGKPIKDFCYNDPGADGKWFTSDDVETYHSILKYDPFGHIHRVIRYTKEGDVFDYTDILTHPKNFLVVKDVVYKGKGADGKWFTNDDEIEKYHRYVYDNRGNLLRAMEYQVKKNGKGKDGIWFTNDDEMSSTKVFLYDKDGCLINIKKYIGPGPDKIWFTEDDVLQYSTAYQNAGAHPDND